MYWYINDHLGTPQELVDGKGNIAWSGLYRSYGQLVVQGGAVRQPLRLTRPLRLTEVHQGHMRATPE
uniref:RHS domain-containing protein n=1 Tax=Phytobacter massiliensis TaxID=1485952 RepID=UPI003BAAD823